MSEIRAASAIRRPALKTGRRPLHRSGGRVQFGQSLTSAVVLPGFDIPARLVLDHLDGGHDLNALRRRAAQLGLSSQRFESLLASLAAADLLEDAAATPPGWRELSAQRRRRLAPGLAALTLARGGPDAGKQAMGRLLSARVLVCGAGPLAAAAAQLLANAGVGVVTTAGDAALPGRADLVLLTADAPADRAAALVEAGTVHLVAGAWANDGVVGPLVQPGRGPCLRCLDLRRSDDDPDWPRVAVQLAATATRTPAVCDVVLATVVAAHAAHAVLAYLDTGRSALVDSTLHLDRAELTWHRQRWTPHPDCPCGVSGVSGPAPSTRPGTGAPGTMAR